MCESQYIFYNSKEKMFMIVSKDDVPLYQRQFDNLVKDGSPNHSRSKEHQYNL